MTAGGSAKVALSITVASAARAGCIPPKSCRLTYIQLVPVISRPKVNANEVMNVFLGLCACKMKNSSAQVRIGTKKSENGAKPRTVVAPRMKAQSADLS